jgi:hypothetical protein
MSIPTAAPRADAALTNLRYPLGLPAGSVRGILTLMVVGLILILMLMPPDRVVPIPVYLYYLMFLIVGHYFAAHGQRFGGRGTGHKAPLHLPRGTLPVLIILGFAAVMGWRYYTERDWAELQPAVQQQPWLPVILLAAFFLGILVNRVTRTVASDSGGPPYWYQDILAWLALLAMLGLFMEVLIQAVINPSLPPERQIQLPQVQTVLAAIVGFYFGARS